MKHGNKIFLIHFLVFFVVALFSCRIEDETERKKLINFIEHDYSRIRTLKDTENFYTELYKEYEKQGIKPAITDWYYKINENEKAIFSYYGDVLYIGIRYQSEEFVPYEIIHSYYESLEHNYGKSHIEDLQLSYYQKSGLTYFQLESEDDQQNTAIIQKEYIKSMPCWENEQSKIYFYTYEIGEPKWSDECLVFIIKDK